MKSRSSSNTNIEKSIRNSNTTRNLSSGTSSIKTTPHYGDKIIAYSKSVSARLHLSNTFACLLLHTTPLVSVHAASKKQRVSKSQRHYGIFKLYTLRKSEKIIVSHHKYIIKQLATSVCHAHKYNIVLIIY